MQIEELRRLCARQIIVGGRPYRIPREVLMASDFRVLPMRGEWQGVWIETERGRFRCEPAEVRQDGEQSIGVTALT